jgi:hypothetical protein
MIVALSMLTVSCHRHVEGKEAEPYNHHESSTQALKELILDQGLEEHLTRVLKAAYPQTRVVLVRLSKSKAITISQLSCLLPIQTAVGPRRDSLEQILHAAHSTGLDHMRETMRYFTMHEKMIAILPNDSVQLAQLFRIDRLQKDPFGVEEFACKSEPREFGTETVLLR